MVSLPVDEVIVVCMVPWQEEAPFVEACQDASGGGQVRYEPRAFALLEPS